MQRLDRLKRCGQNAAQVLENTFASGTRARQFIAVFFRLLVCSMGGMGRIQDPSGESGRRLATVFNSRPPRLKTGIFSLFARSKP